MKLVENKEEGERYVRVPIDLGRGVDDVIHPFRGHRFVSNKINKESVNENHDRPYRR